MKPSAGKNLLLLDEGWAITPYLAKGLKQAGYTVYSFSTEYRDPKFLASYLTQIQAPQISAPEYIEELNQVITAREFAAILPLTENIFYKLWDATFPWSEKIYPATKDWQRDLMRSKHRLSEFVASYGVSIPAHCRINSLQDVPAAVRRLGLPVVVKGANGRAGSHVCIAASEAEATKRVNEMASDGDEWPILQQYIDGATFLVGGLFHEGNALRLYAAEQVEMCHSRTSPSIRVKSNNDPALCEQAVAAFHALRWSGFANADFVRDADGHYYFLEINPRPWGSMMAATSAGVNFFEPFGKLLQEEIPAANLRFRHGVSSTLFPQYLQAQVEKGGLREVARMAKAIRGWREVPWRSPALTMHMMRRVYWQWHSLTQLSRNEREATAATTYSSLAQRLGKSV